jgi:hypothetical protein
MCVIIVVILLQKIFEEINLGFRDCVLKMTELAIIAYFFLKHPPEDGRKWLKHVGGLSHILSIIVSNCYAVDGVFAVVVSRLWVCIRRRVGFWQVD